MKTTKVSQTITITVGDQEIKLTRDEARNLLKDLSDAIGERYEHPFPTLPQLPKLPIYYPPAPFENPFRDYPKRPDEPYWPTVPTITYTTSPASFHCSRNECTGAKTSFGN